MTVRDLKPTEIWQNFSDLNAVPRPSKKEERVIQFMVDFGKSLGLKTETDRIGNIIIKKAATPGMENRETVILQSHVDMVHQKNADTDFDFDSEGIRMIVEGDWVKAEGTTLGADNGIGVATIMGVLASKDIPHPALEAMFTVDEETGMTGAMELEPEYYEGKILLNLDTEDDDELSIGCAGGIDTNTRYSYSQVPTPSHVRSYVLKLRGLMGGHSGMDIHKGRANSNKLMGRLLYDAPVTCFLHEFDGGSLRNAIPREATVLVSVHETDALKFEDYVTMQKSIYSAEYSPVESNLSLTLEAIESPIEMVSEIDTARILKTIYAVHNGVYKWSLSFEDLVETSSSLARVIVKDGDFITQSLQRSSVESTKKDVANAVKSVFELIGAEIEQSGDYPGWEPNPNSTILTIMAEMYRSKFNEEPQIKACHAGLECGILGKHLPEVDMISFGPNIRHAHSPDECVQISSVQKFWDFLLDILRNIPEKNQSIK
jgi:dipeptidase D